MIAFIGGQIIAKAIDANSNIKSVEYIVNIYVESIEEIEKANLVQIATEHATSFKIAR